MAFGTTKRLARRFIPRNALVNVSVELLSKSLKLVGVMMASASRKIGSICSMSNCPGMSNILKSFSESVKESSPLSSHPRIAPEARQTEGVRSGTKSLDWQEPGNHHSGFFRYHNGYPQKSGPAGTFQRCSVACRNPIHGICNRPYRGSHWTTKPVCFSPHRPSDWQKLLTYLFRFWLLLNHCQTKISKSVRQSKFY